jgi:hypothetical protein
MQAWSQCSFNFRYVGNVHVQVTDMLLREVFQSVGLVEGCKLIRKEKVWLCYLFLLSAGYCLGQIYAMI